MYKKRQAAIERTSFAAGSRKGQAAMEYLMTYGWAFLVIVIVLAILAFYLPTLLRAPESCLFSQPGFSCDVQKPVIVSETGTNLVYVIFRLDNQQGQEVNITRVRCTMEAEGNIQKSDEDKITPSESIPSGGSEEFKEYCYDSTGASGLTMGPNSNFRGTIAIWYRYKAEVTGAPERMATATIGGTVLEQ